MTELGSALDEDPDPHPTCVSSAPLTGALEPSRSPRRFPGFTLNAGPRLGSPLRGPLALQRPSCQVPSCGSSSGKPGRIRPRHSRCLARPSGHGPPPPRNLSEFFFVLAQRLPLVFVRGSVCRFLCAGGGPQEASPPRARYHLRRGKEARPFVSHTASPARPAELGLCSPQVPPHPRPRRFCPRSPAEPRGFCRNFRSLLSSLSSFWISHETTDHRGTKHSAQVCEALCPDGMHRPSLRPLPCGPLTAINSTVTHTHLDGSPLNTSPAASCPTASRPASRFGLCLQQLLAPGAMPCAGGCPAG